MFFPESADDTIAKQDRLLKEHRRQLESEERKTDEALQELDIHPEQLPKQVSDEQEEKIQAFLQEDF